MPDHAYEEWTPYLAVGQILRGYKRNIASIPEEGTFRPGLNAGIITLDSPGPYGASFSNWIMFNDFRDSTLPGWTEDNPLGPGAVLFAETSEDNWVEQPRALLPQENMNLCEQIRDDSDSQNNDLGYFYAWYCE